MCGGGDRLPKCISFGSNATSISTIATFCPPCIGSWSLTKQTERSLWSRSGATPTDCKSTRQVLSSFLPPAEVSLSCCPNCVYPSFPPSTRQEKERGDPLALRPNRLEFADARSFGRNFGSLCLRKRSSRKDNTRAPRQFNIQITTFKT